MGATLSDISVLIWDFDGTLYRQKPALWEQIRAGEIQVIMDHTGWDRARASDEFYRIYRHETPSGTTTVARITGISNAQASIETSAHTKYRQYLEKDERLAEMFRSLSGFTQYMLVNGTQDSVSRGLSVLGVSRSLFAEIVTSEVVGATKPDPSGFRYILERTHLPPMRHLMIGDREEVDLAPAKALGMRTCLVWSESPGAVADITVRDVYTLPNVLG